MLARTRYSGMSDDQLANEEVAQNKLAHAINTMREAIRIVNYNSALVKIDLSTFDNLVHDEFPSEDLWDEKIADARA